VTRLRLGVIGAGAWTVASHLPNLMARADEVEFVAVNRRDPELLGRIARQFGFAHAYTDYRDVLASGIDICVVASPARWHHEHAAAALDAGAHVLVEKPFTIAPLDAWDLVSRAERGGRHLLVAFGANYQPMVRAAKRLMDQDGGVGEVEYVMVHMASMTRELLEGRPMPFASSLFPVGSPELLAEAGTSADPDTSGGGYAQTQLSHALGLALWLTGLRGKDVAGILWRREGLAVEYHAAATITFAEGAIGSISGASCHWGARGGKHQQEVRIIGSLGQLHVDMERELVWRYRGINDETVVPFAEGDGRYECRGPIDALVDLAQGRAVVNASPGALGARVVEIIDALYRSERSGRPAAIATTAEEEEHLGTSLK
jgi:predicted dehydrogenase